MDWAVSLHRFTPGSRAHALVLLATALDVLLLIRAGQILEARSDSGGGRRWLPGAFVAALCVAAAAAWVAVFVRDLLPDRRGWGNSLPLHLCDVAGLVAPLALYTGRRPLRAVLHLWAFTFTIQAFLTPVVRVGPAHADFWLYWVSHGAIVAAAAYDAAVLGFRPRWADCRCAVLAGLAYAAVVMPVDAVLGANYGYLGNTGGARQSLVAAFGPWPARVPVLMLAAATIMALLTLPWEWAGWWQEAGRRAGGVADRLPPLGLAARA